MDADPRDLRIQQLEAENQALRQRIDELEQLLAPLQQRTEELERTAARQHRQRSRRHTSGRAGAGLGRLAQ